MNNFVIDYNVADCIMINRQKHYNIHTIEIKDIRCIHQGSEKEDDRHFASFNVLILN